jgi:hypothetical protein
MQTLRERLLAEEWLPSRFHLAIFRVLGLAMAIATRRRTSTAVMLHHDREQHPLEAYAMSCALIAVPSVHLFGALLPRLRWPWATAPLVALALPFAAIVAWDIVVFAVVLVVLAVRSATGSRFEPVRLQGAVIHSLMVALAAASIALGWATAWLGYAWLGLVATNAACALVLFLVRGSVDRFSRQVMAGP